MRPWKLNTLGRLAGPRAQRLPSLDGGTDKHLSQRGKQGAECGQEGMTSPQGPSQKLLCSPF